jgi:hypothetical protein
MPVFRRLPYVVAVSLLIPLAAMADGPGQAVEAVTAGGDRVVLHPNGRWEYVDTGKAKAAKEISQQYPENQGCPPGWQGGLLGIGRCIPPGDPDFNRGSRIGK